MWGLKTWQLVALGVGVLGVAAVARNMMGGSSGGAGDQPVDPNAGKKGDPFAQFRNDAGFQKADQALGGLLSWTNGINQVAAKAATDKKNQDNALRIVQGGIESIAGAFG